MTPQRLLEQARISQAVADQADILSSIRLQTTLPSQPTIEGTLFTACPITNLVAIATTTSPNTPPTHHILPITSIHNFTLLSAPPPSNDFSSPPNTTPPLSNVPTAALLARADAAVARLKEAASRKNKNVGKEAQDLFDGISRTLPTRWDGNNIVVMDSVVISSPYRGEDCKAGNGVPPTTLSRVRKVVSPLQQLLLITTPWLRFARKPGRQRTKEIRRSGAENCGPCCPCKPRRAHWATERWLDGRCNLARYSFNLDHSTN